MRRIVIWLASTVTIVVLLFGYHTSTSSTTPVGVSSSVSSPADPSASASSSTPSGTSSSAPSADPTTSSTPSATASSSSAAKTYTGTVADTRWGPVQVEITVSDAKVTAVDVVQYPSGNGKDAEINDYALPILVQETIKEQSASIDVVSGATVTSDGYLQSLQSALDEAGI